MNEQIKESTPAENMELIKKSVQVLLLRRQRKESPTKGEIADALFLLLAIAYADQKAKI